MKTKIIYGCLLGLIFTSCKKSEEPIIPLHPMLRTDGLYIGRDIDTYMFHKNKEGKNEGDDCYSIIRFYESGKGMAMMQRMQKGNNIPEKAIKEIYNNPREYWNYRNLYRPTPSMESTLFQPEVFANDSIKFREYLTLDSKNIWKDYKGVVYKDSMELNFEIKESAEERAFIHAHQELYYKKHPNKEQCNKQAVSFKIPHHKIKYSFYPVSK